MERRALTLVELLVILAIVAVMAALLLPAVQAARESSRRLQCTSNLRQVALALHHYESAYRVLPATAFANYSFHVPLLPYLEQSAIYDQIDWSVNAMDYDGPLNRVRVAVFECPSDDSRRRVPPLMAATNFYGNWGSGAQRYGNNGAFCYRSDFAGYRAFMPLAAITDGLSETAMMAEVAASDRTLRSPSVVWETRRLTAPNELDEFAAACKAAPFATLSQKPRSVQRGRPWLACHAISNLYNHVLPPNSPTCSNGGFFAYGALSSSSFHGPTVNVAMADGSIRSIADSIEIAVWRTIGSRAGDP
jgi:prepilin-type processing-associated H-X9-DG protein